ncbi:MAG: adenylate/guanylate cyclase domain-containing protein [Solirubrobacterales bacterium]|nr:adenylate/guanylate cyclase domain-containing protein [Solirubrobacterales bacterium]
MCAVAQDPVAAGRAAFAQRHWERAWELLSGADRGHPLGAEDLEQLAQAACWTRRYDAMIELLERAEAVYERDGNRRGAARAALALAREHFQRCNEAVMAGWLGRAENLLAGEPESRETGLLLWAKVHGSLLMASDMEHILERATQLLVLARRLRDPDLEALGLLEQGHALIIAERAPEGLPILDQAAALAMTAASDLTTTGTVYCSTIFAYRNVGDWQRAAEWTDEALRWCRRHSVSGFPGLCRLHRAEIIRVRGVLEEAEREAQAACDELLAWAPRYAGWACQELGEVRRRRGDAEGAREAFEQALALGFDPQPGLALLRLDEGDPDGALAGISRRLADRDVFAQEGRTLLLPAQLTIAVAAGRGEVARAALAELEALAAAGAATGVRASVAVARGEALLGEGRAGEAVGHLREGWRLWSAIGARFDAARARMLLGRAYATTQDIAAARLELEGAGRTFKEIGAHVEQQRIRELVSGLGRGVRETQTFVFTDIVDSTRLVESLGDEAWDGMLAWHDRMIRDCIGEHRGREIKHEGDGMFIAFPEPACGLNFAISLQRKLESHRRVHGFAPRVRIGMHAAEAIRRGSDFSGQGVHVAARVTAIGDGGQILATAATLQRAGGSYRTAEPRMLELKGVAEVVEVVEVAWRQRG